MILSAIDYVVIAVYLAVTLFIGRWFRSRANKDISENFVSGRSLPWWSGRSLPWWIADTSMVATTFAANTPLAVTGLTIQNGLAGNWVWWPIALGGMVTVFGDNALAIRPWHQLWNAGDGWRLWHDVRHVGRRGSRCDTISPGDFGQTPDLAAMILFRIGDRCLPPQVDSSPVSPRSTVRYNLGPIQKRAQTFRFQGPSTFSDRLLI